MDNSHKIVSIPDVNTIYSEASEWLVLLEDGDVSAENLAKFKAWYAKSEKHREAFAERAALWKGFDQVALLNDIAVSDETVELLKQDTNVFPLDVLTRRSVVSAIAATLCVAVGLGVLVNGGVFTGSSWPQESQTRIGEQKEVELSDGSLVHLNTDSEIKVRYDRERRVVQLVRGEAFFDVERDPGRPFSVMAGDKSVAALGTAFSVRRMNGKVDVTVTHGRVALFAQKQQVQSAEYETVPSREKPIAEITAGQNVVFDREVERLETIEPEVLVRQLSWRDGLLAFAGDPLSKVVSDVGRYTGVAIEIEGEEFANLPISGYVKIGEYEEMFEALEIMAGLEAIRVSPNRVRLVKVQGG